MISLFLLSLSPALAEPASPEAVLASLREALGTSPSSLHLSSDTTFIDWGQSPGREEQSVVSHSHEERRMSADGDQELHIEQHVAYPYAFPLEWTERIDQATRGSIEGADTFLGDKRRPVSAARLSVREKQRLLANPAWLVQAIVPVAVHHGEEGLVLEATWEGGPLSLLLDATGERLVEVRFLEDLPPLGDVSVAVQYGDWREEPLVPYLAPYLVQQRVDGRLVRVEVRNRVEPAVDFAVEPTADAPQDNAVEHKLGWQRATWFSDWMGFGFPQDDGASTFDLSWREVADGVFLGWGEFHNVVVVELGSSKLALIEAPLSPELTDNVLQSVSARWPKSEITATVVTHHHLDHIGGIRAVAEKGIPLVVPAGDEDWFRALLSRPAELGGRPAVTAPQLVPVSDRYVIEGAERTVEVRAIGNVHAEDMLMVWIPDAQLVHVADLLNPGLIPTRGPYGWLARHIIAGIDPYDLAKAGTYASTLDRILAGADVEPQRIIGGHGPQVAHRHALRVLTRRADEDIFEARQVDLAWPPRSSP